MEISESLLSALYLVPLSFLALCFSLLSPFVSVFLMIIIIIINYYKLIIIIIININ